MDIRIRIRANPICFHPKRWKLEGNTNMIIRDIRIHIRANPIRFHPYLSIYGVRRPALAIIIMEPS